MKLNDLVSFIKFSLNCSPPYKCTLPVDQQNVSMQLSHTTDTKLNYKTRTVTECDLQPTATALTETGNKKI